MTGIEIRDKQLRAVWHIAGGKSGRDNMCLPLRAQFAQTHRQQLIVVGSNRRRAPLRALSMPAHRHNAR